MKYLVTGGAGFIGSNLVAKLVRTGKKVRVLDNFSTGKLGNLSEFGSKVEVLKGDIRDLKTARRAVKGIKYVFHEAALPSVPRSVADPLTSNEVNIGGILNMLVASRDEGVERFIFASSSSVYGDTPVLPKKEDMLPAPLSPYAVHKLTGEHYCRIFFTLYGLKTFALRYFNVFGPRQDPASHYAAVIPLFLSAIRANKSPTIYGDGNQTRDFTFVDDVVSANICCCTAPAKAAGGVYNVACGRRITVNALANGLIKIIGSGVKPVHVPVRAGDVRDSQADSSRAMKILGWKPAVKFEDGLKTTVEWFLR
ncbi:MAG: SDR family oxidoreductase [bacterium]